jgi:hypothetical protein
VHIWNLGPGLGGKSRGGGLPLEVYMTCVGDYELKPLLFEKSIKKKEVYMLV